MDTIWRIVSWVLSPWVIVGSVLLALVLCGVTFSFLWFTRPGPAAVVPATAVLSVVQAPTFTPIQATATTAPTVTPPSSVPPSPPPGVIQVGDKVQISGTSGDGLRLRSEAGLKGQVRLLGAEAEVFVVKDGPKEADGFTWWFLEGLYDAKRSGWGVSNYLAVVQG